MKPIAKIICSVIVLAWWQTAAAADVTVSEQAGSVVLQSLSDTSAADQASSAPAQADQGAQSAARVPVKPSYEKVDSARIKKRIADRAARKQQRKLEAEKEAATRAAKTQP